MKKIKAITIDDDEPDELGEDPYLSKRLHCWVLLKAGKREFDKHVFIEPSTGLFFKLTIKGRIYPINSSPYESVDCVFNNHNFWINMKPDCDVIWF